MVKKNGRKRRGEVELMEKFTRVMRGYDPDEVNNFLDQVIKRVEKMIADIDKKNKLIESKNEEIKKLQAQIED